MSYRFAHLADVHWRGLSRHGEYKRAFTKAFELIREQEVDAIFVAGDIVHSKTQGISPELIDHLCWWFKELSSIAPTYITLGNHDGLILNKDREDAISPIVRALNLPNLHLIKNSVKVDFDDNIEIVNFSCFDEENWKNLEPDPNKISIAVYHGAVWGSLTDTDWEIAGEIEVERFAEYDFGFFGDIHKQQYLNSRKSIAYPGSCIPQNFAEGSGKGFLLWDIESRDKYSSRLIEIPHDRPFVTIDWKGSVADTLDEAEAHPDEARFRVRTSVPVSQGEIKQLYSALKEFKQASEIVMKQEINNSELVLESLDAENIINLSTPGAVINMITEYYSRTGLDERTIAKLDKLVHRLWKSAIKTDKPACGKWSINSLEFDNMFGYGRDNYINFDNCTGITGLFGKNRAGKSSICGTIAYNLFNGSDRGSISNQHIINTRKGHCRTKMGISKSGKNYIIERQSVKNQARSGKVSATTQLNLFEADQAGNVICDLNGEQRRETEKTLRALVGTHDDFMLTSFAAQGEMNKFLKQKATSRKATLSRFLELDVFDRLHEAAKAESAGIKQLLKNTPDRDFGITILDTKNKLKAREKERSVLGENIEDERARIADLEVTIATRGDHGLVTQHDIDEQVDKISRLNNEVELLVKKIAAGNSEYQELSTKAKKIKQFRDKFPIDSLRESIQEQRTLENTVSTTKHSADKEKQKLKSFIKEVSKLSEVPCGDDFPTCQYILSAQKAKKEAKRQEGKIEDIKKDLSLAKKMLKKLTDKNLEAKLEKFNELIAQFNTHSADASKIELSMTKDSSRLKAARGEIDRAEQALDEMRANVATDDAASQIRALRDKLRKMKAVANSSERKYAELSEDIGLYQANIQNLIKKKDEFDELNNQWKIFDLFLKATSKNGVPLEVIRAILPEINMEIATILQGVTGFTVELESDEGSNEMAIYINYGDSKRIIECASGMEKMMSALAIRVALINVSSLPKSDILIIDEGFGTLDEGNVEACERLLESLKKWFKTIVVISHVDAVKDSADCLFEITKVGPDSKIRYE